MTFNMEDMKKDFEESKFTGVSSNGLVKVVVNGNAYVSSVDIDDVVLNSKNKELISKLIVEAIADGIKCADAYVNEYMVDKTKELQNELLKAAQAGIKPAVTPASSDFDFYTTSFAGKKKSGGFEN